MAIVGEDGAGIPNAEAYGATPEATLVAYWAARPTDPLAGKVAAATMASRESGLRLAATYMDATWGAFFRGSRASVEQAREYPRVAGLDVDGNPIPLTDALGRELPALPAQLIAAQNELTARALSAPLATDLPRFGMLLRERKEVGSLKSENEYAVGAPTGTAFGIVLGILAPLLDGSQPGAASPTWFWA